MEDEKSVKNPFSDFSNPVVIAFFVIIIILVMVPSNIPEMFFGSYPPLQQRKMWWAFCTVVVSIIWELYKRTNHYRKRYGVKEMKLELKSFIDINRLKRALLLDSKVYGEIEEDENSLLQSSLLVFSVAFFISFIKQRNIIVAMFDSLMLWTISAIIINLIAKFFKRPSLNKSIFKALAYTYVPSILLVVSFDSMIIASIALIWSLLCKIVAVQGVYEFSKIKSTLVIMIYLIPYSILSLLI